MTQSAWADLVGQEPAVALLREAAAGTGMTHAWLLTGPPGSGRSNAARSFAQELLTEPQDAAAQARVKRGTHESLTVLATDKSMISIEEVRALVATAHQAPVGSPWRVIIIEDADRMTERTSNVLLKAIEEPPPATVWILCAPSPQDVLTTIRSRCRTVVLRTPPVAAVALLLMDRDGVEPETARWAAAAAQCHIGRARRLGRSESARLERRANIDIVSHMSSLGATVRIAGRTVEVAKERAVARTQERLEADMAQLRATLGLAEGERVPPGLRAQIRRLEDDNKRRETRARNDEIDSTFLDLLAFYRDVLAQQLGAGVEPINRGEHELIAQAARDSDPETTLRRIDVLLGARRRLQTNTALLLVVEAAFVGLSNPWSVI